MLFSLGASKPVHVDDTDFLVAGDATARTLTPIYYRGVGRKNASYTALYHPPLYIYLLAGWFGIFGAGEAPARMFGFVCALLQGWVVSQIIYAISGAAILRRAMPWLWPLFLLNPYTIQTASVLDIDSTIYGPLLCVVLLGVLRMCWRDGERRTDQISWREYFLLTAALTLSFWAKLTTVWLLPPFCVLLLVPRLGRAGALRSSASVTAAAFGCFLVTYFVYGRILHVDIGRSFSFTFASLQNRGSSGPHGFLARVGDFIRNWEFMAPYMVRWTGALPWAAVAAALVLFCRRAIRSKDVRLYHYFCLLLLAALTTVYYLGQQPAFAAAPYKYAFCYWALLLSALPMTYQLLWSNIKSSDRGVTVTWKASILTNTVLGAIALSGFLWARTGIRDQAQLSAEALSSTPQRASIALPVLLLASGIAWRALRGRRSLLPGARLYSAGVCLYAGLELGIAVWQGTVSYSTTYNYGQSGIEEAALYIAANTAPTDIVASMKDLGFRARRPYFETYAPMYGDAAALRRLEQGIASGAIKLAVFTEGRGEDQLIIAPALKSWIEEHCDKIASFGNYRIYKKKT